MVRIRGRNRKWSGVRGAIDRRAAQTRDIDIDGKIERVLMGRWRWDIGRWWTRDWASQREHSKLTRREDRSKHHLQSRVNV